MTLKNQQITYHNPIMVSQSIQTALRALADSQSISLGEATNYCLDRVPDLTDSKLTKLRGKSPPRYTRDGQSLMTLIWVLLADGMMHNRTDARSWLVDLLNATDLLADDITDTTWEQVVQLFVDNVAYIQHTPSTDHIIQTLSRLKQPSTASLDSTQRHIPAHHPIFVGRDDNLHDLKARLGVINKSSRRALTIMRGWPGVGKTALINTLVHDETVGQAFTDGVLWAILGPKAEIKSTLKSWAQQLGANHLLQLVDLDDLTKGLRAVLATRDILVVVDDVWTEEDGNIIKHVVDLNHNTLLMTTRFTDLAVELRDHKDDEYILQPLSEAYAIELLSILAPDVAKTHVDRFPKLAQSVENLPLALRVAGPLLQYYHDNHLEIEPFFEEFETYFLSKKAPSNRFDEETGKTPTIELLFQRSIETLSETYQQDFALLGILRHKPATFERGVMQKVWHKQNITDSLITIIGRGLLEPVPDGRYYMHRTLHLYANKLLDNYDKYGRFL